MKTLTVKNYLFKLDGTIEITNKDIFLTDKNCSANQYTGLELIQQAVTDLELSDLEQGQTITDLEIMILEGKVHV